MAKLKNNLIKECLMCGKEFSAYRSLQRYCSKCGTLNSVRIKRESAKRSFRKKYAENPEKFRKKRRKNYLVNQEKIKAIGKETSKEQRFSIADIPSPDLKWSITIKYPFTQALSKNATWRSNKKGYVYLRKESREARESLTLLIKNAFQNSDIKVVQNKLWISILVEKPNARSDAINFLDNICDAIKIAVAVDDRWFSIKGIDWCIVKENPNFYITIGQEDVIDSQVCSYCGRILPFNYFTKNRSTKIGISRECKECRQKIKVSRNKN